MKNGVDIGGRVFDVIIPLPANSDECMKNIGINDFDDADDEWDNDFLAILTSLIDGQEYSISTTGWTSKDRESLGTARLSDIQSLLAYYDHVDFVISVRDRKITFTRGHEILWLEGFENSKLHSLNFEIEESRNERIKELF